MDWKTFQIRHPEIASRFVAAGDWESTDEKPEDFTFTAMKGGKFRADGSVTGEPYIYYPSRKDWDYVD